MCFVKRTIDILLGLCGVVLCGPFLAIMMAASVMKISNVKIGKAPRLGKNGQTGWSLRLRHANGWPAWWRCAARLALSGAQLTSGKLTLVGPRPLLPSHKKTLHPMVSGMICERHGIVYLPRIIVPSGSDLSSVDAAILYYCKNWNIALDIQILLGKIIRRSRYPAGTESGSD